MRDEFIADNVGRTIALIREHMEKRGLKPNQYIPVLKELAGITPELTWLKRLDQSMPSGHAGPGVASCFMSFSNKDEEFTTYLHSRLLEANIEVYYSFADIKGGQKVHDQIEREIEKHRRLLLILSENSMQSQGVITEIRIAREIEIRENQKKLFPVRLIDYDTVKKWKCFDSDTGMDLAVELRKYYIPDFSNWKDQDSFESEFHKLLRDLKAE